MSETNPLKDSSGVPYQAYQSKRHSRTPSKPKSYFIPNVSPPLNSRPSSLVSTSLPLESEKQYSSSGANSQSKRERSASSGIVAIDHKVFSDSHGQSTMSSSNGAVSKEIITVPGTITPEPPSLEDNSASTSTAMPSEGSSLISSTPTRKVSTFRRVAPRNPRTFLPTSPLGHGPVSLPSPAISTSRRSSPVDSIAPQIAELNGTGSHTTLPVSTVHASHSGVLSLPPIVASMSRPSSSNGTQSPLRVPVLPTSIEPSISHSSTTSYNRSSAPYRPGFQPHGTRIDLTDDFLTFRRAKRENDGVARVERSKLERRLDKLIVLHFPTIDQEDNNVSGRRPNLVHAKDNRRASSFFDLDNLKHMSIHDASDLWRGILGGGLVDNTKLDIRDAEQRITPWQDDAIVTKCPLCRVSFHPLTNRKHHCRLCGQIICSLPPRRPQRSESCSLLFVVDPKSRQIEEVGEGVDYGVRKRKTSKSSNGLASEPVQEDGEKFLKGVRICRECRPVLLRKHYEQEKIHRPIFFRLYQAFLNLETEIEESLPQFQELVLSLSHHDQPSKDASTARKRILDAFSRYDALSKQIRQLPCPNGPGSSQDRVQMAITTRANLFLQKNMFPLKSLPMSKPAVTPSTTPIKGRESRPDPDANLALRLQPLLEQEALLESFVEEAKAHRKFEDVKTLKVNLAEIRQEIRRIYGD